MRNNINLNLCFLDGDPDGLNLKTYPNEQTIKASKCNFQLIKIIMPLFLKKNS